MGKELEIEKLKGGENYHTWTFAVKNLLQFKGFQKCITDPVSETDAGKLQNCQAILALSVEPQLYVHIQNCSSGLEIWKTLKNLFDDKGLSRRISLLRSLISTRLEDCENMQQYVDKIKNCANKLTGIGFDMGNEWIGSILLAGLTENFAPFIMGIEASGVDVEADSIIAKLLDSQASGGAKAEAFIAKKKFNKNFKGPRNCYICGSKNHISPNCDKKKDGAGGSGGAGGSKGAGSSRGAGNARNAFIALLSRSEQCDWYIDSGASSHMTPHADLLTGLKPAKVSQVLSANSAKMKVQHSGNANLRINGEQINVNDVLHVPDLAANLLSVCKIVNNGNSVLFDKNGCTIRNASNEVIARCKAENGVYKFRGSGEACMLSRANAESSNNVVTWHRRFGHIGYQNLLTMRNGAVVGMKFKENASAIAKCETCAMGKQSRLPFPASERKSTQLLELIHSDLCGPMENVSIGRAKYFLTFIDDYSKKVFCYFIGQKDQVLEKFIEFKMMVENQTEKRIKTFRTDNGKEYLSGKFDNFFAANGIRHELTCPYTAQQNGVAERYNRTMVERARCLLHDAELPKTYWAEAVNMAVYLINRSSRAALKDKTPEEIWSGVKVDVSHLKIFGSPVMVHVPKERRKKFDYKSRKLIFVGYDERSKGYRCIDRATGKLTVSRDVIFFEKPDKLTINIDDGEPESDSVEDVKEDQNDQNDQNDSVKPEENVDLEASAEAEEEPKDEVIELDDTIPSPEGRDPDYVPDESIGQIRDTPITTRSRGNQFRHFQSSHFAFFVDPSTVGQAKSSECAESWRLAMDEEIKSHGDNHTWSLVKLPEGRKAIKAKWVFKTKRDENGEILRYKARLVAKGCSQKYGIDYDETYSPVVRYSSVRLLIALAVQKKMKIHQMDAVTAFLQGDLDEDIFMEQPEGYDDGSGRVCKLNRAVYGLKQAGRQWNLKLDAALLGFGLKKSRMDPCVYFRENAKLLIAIYVDDFLIFYKETGELDEMRNLLNGAFKMKDLGPAKSCIGIRIRQTGKSIELDQTHYVLEILERFGMADCKPVQNPCDTNQKLSKELVNDGNSLVDIVPYQEAVGSLLFLMQATRPDIAFAVNNVSRFNGNHSEIHWQAVKRIFRYLRGTTELRLRYTSDNAEEMHAFTDADWASEVDDRRSCSGYVLKMANAAISWASKRQPIVALSSTEAEYIALSSAVKEIIWTRQLLEEIDGKLGRPTTLYCDNQSTIKLAASDAFRPRTKHIDIRFHHVREKIEDKTIDVDFLSTTKMIADSLTKAVNKEKVKFCTIGMGLINDN